ncbi:hypothetical protein PG985_003975 [Apiospora marii]|uniref:uncharacterized protein n=1 Tax=Apiospora marii TaxID=335849 RepID=UPI00312CF5D9
MPSINLKRNWINLKGNNVFNIPPEAPRGPYSDSVPWNKGEELTKGVEVDDEFKKRLGNYTYCSDTKGSVENPGVVWACHYGVVPGEDDDPVTDDAGVKYTTIGALNEDPQVVQDRGDAVSKMAWEQAKDLGFPWVIIKGATHESRTKRDTVANKNIPGQYVIDKNHFTINLSTDRERFLVSGHIYVVGDKNWVPQRLMEWRAVNGVPQRVIDLYHCETKKEKLARIAREKAEANNKPKNKRGMGH